jgi:glyceraldehyde 3-phosphate dehydrogenase
MRVPTPNVSAVDLTFMAGSDTSVDDINACFAEAANGKLKGILGTTDEPLVSIDLNHDSRSSIVALDQTKVMNSRFCRVLAWYDNEWGFSVRMLDTAAAMGALI